MLQDLAQGGSRVGSVLHNGPEDVVKQAPPSIGGAMDLDGVDGGRGEEVLVELEIGPRSAAGAGGGRLIGRGRGFYHMRWACQGRLCRAGAASGIGFVGGLCEGEG